MKILVVHNSLNDSKSLSGALRHFLVMANEWTAMGHQTDFLCPKCAFPQIRELAPHAGLISSDNLFDATQYISQTWRYLPAYAWRLITCHFTRLPEKYDVVFASSQILFEIQPAMVLARRLGAKLAVKIHHVVSAQRKPTGFFDRLFCYFERRSGQWIHDRGDRLICSTQIVLDHFHEIQQSLGISPSPGLTSGYGVDTAAFDQLTGEPKLYDVVHLSRIHQTKGVLDLPEIWHAVRAKHPHAKLLIIGEGPHRARTDQAFRDLGLSESVTFTGGIDELTKNRLVRQSKIGLSVSYEEGWGLSVNEFLAAQLPVVAYRLPVFDLVFKNQLESVPLGDKQAAAKSICLLLENPDRCEELGVLGRAFVQSYDIGSVARAELAALQSLF
ncbi:MAG: glycosyltransferase [Pedosphaera sp.]|nr:glycosyltransferase [Pedosphaera sp.]